MAQAAGPGQDANRVPQALLRYVWPEQVERQVAQENGGGHGPAGIQVIQVIQRAGAILDTLRATEIRLSLGQSARETGLARSTVQALQDADWVTPPGPDGGVFLGPSSSNPPPPPAVGRPIWSFCTRTWNSTPASSARPSTCPSAGMTALFVDQVTAGLPLRAVSAVGETFPLHCSENGKEMLATLPDLFIETIIGRSSPACTDKALTALPALLGYLIPGRDKRQRLIGGRRYYHCLPCSVAQNG
jgi:Bacterial transcriptional regulator